MPVMCMRGIHLLTRGPMEDGKPQAIFSTTKNQATNVR